jgi:trans-aconitate methyltransferase
MNLDQIALHHGTDKSSRSHWYTRYYEKFFGNVREEISSVLELGVGSGASIRMWMEFFPNALIYGVDQSPVTGDFGGRVTLHQCEQTDSEALHSHFGDVKLELIIDDCSHNQDKTIESLKILYPMLQPGGWYIIEDMDRDFVEPIRWGLVNLAKEVHALIDKDGCSLIVIRKSK